jgi:hypothetical protein
MFLTTGRRNSGCGEALDAGALANVQYQTLRTAGDRFGDARRATGAAGLADQRLASTAAVTDRPRSRGVARDAGHELPVRPPAALSVIRAGNGIQKGPSWSSVGGQLSTL